MLSPNSSAITSARMRQVGKGQERGGVRVIDEFMRKERMKKRFHRRVGRRRIHKIGALDVDHFLVRKRIERPQFQKRRQLYRRKTGCLDGAEVPSRSLTKNIDGLTENIRRHRFAGRVAASMHDEVGHLSDELGRVDTVRKILLQLAIARICEPVRISLSFHLFSNIFVSTNLPDLGGALFPRAVRDINRTAQYFETSKLAMAPKTRSGAFDIMVV